jgi:hypothetical protein
MRSRLGRTGPGSSGRRMFQTRSLNATKQKTSATTATAAANFQSNRANRRQNSFLMDTATSRNGIAPESRQKGTFR